MTDNIPQDLIENEQFQSLADMAGVEAVQAILEAFWKSNHELLKEIKEHLAEEDFSNTAKAAHALKGSAANLGAVQITDRARRLERACKESDKHTALVLLGQLNTDIQTTRTAFSSLIGNLAA